VTVTNTGKVAEEYFIDGRLDQATRYGLTARSSAKVTVPIPGTTVPPEYFVPAHTTSITAAATAPAPIYFDYWWYFGDPDLISTSPPLARDPTGTFSSAPVVPGQWFITPYQNGPDGGTALPPVTAHTTMTATTMRFDPALSSPTGDLWRQSIDPSAAFAPRILRPGQTASIPVTIDPTGAPGTTVTGTLFLDDTTLAAGDTDWLAEGYPPLPTATDVAAFPYRYTIK
jgi:hypothetical protein